MNELLKLQEQIQKLQKMAAELKVREFDATVQDIVAKMEAFGITAKDLLNATKRRRPKAKSTVEVTAKAKKAKGATKKVAAKYRGPNGETWTGRGMTPLWMKGALEMGRTKESLEIKAETT